MYLRSFEKGKNKYYYIAKAVRIKDKVIQKSILYLGTADRIYKKLKSQKMNSDAMPDLLSQLHNVTNSLAG